MTTSQKRTVKISNTLGINFDHVDRRNCYIEATSLGAQDFKKDIYGEQYPIKRRYTVAKYKVPRRYRPSFWKGYSKGWQSAWESNKIPSETKIASIKAYVVCEFCDSPDAINWIKEPKPDGTDINKCHVSGCINCSKIVCDNCGTIDNKNNTRIFCITCIQDYCLQ